MDERKNPTDFPRSVSQGDQALRLSEARFRALAESASDAIVTIDLNSKILFANGAAEQIFGYAREELQDREITMLMPEYLRHVHKSALARYNESGQRHLHWARIQLPGLRKDGHEIPVELSIAEHWEGREKRFTGILRDISDRVKAQEALTRQTSIIRLLQNVAVAANQANSIAEAITAALSEVCQHTEAEVGHAYFVQGDSSVRLVPSTLWYSGEPEKFATFRAVTEATILNLGEGLPGRVAETGTPVWIKDVSVDPNFPRNRLSSTLNVRGAFAFPIVVNGDVTAVLEFFFSEEKNPDEQLLEATTTIGGQLGRVVERKRTEESLRKLSGRLLRSQDEERRRIGRELHDSAGQYLVALQMNLDDLAERLRQSWSDPFVRKKVSESVDLTQRCSNEIRTLSYLLHPPLLEDTGLASTIRWYVEGFAKRSGISLTVDVDSEFGRLSANAELALFRIVQESLTNIHRHSGSKSGSVRLSVTGTVLILEVIDQGRGMSPEVLAKLSGGAGVGIAGMRERLRELGGTLEITSDAHGTIVLASIPIARLDDSERRLDSGNSH